MGELKLLSLLTALLAGSAVVLALVDPRSSAWLPLGLAGISCAILSLHDRR